MTAALPIGAQVLVRRDDGSTFPSVTLAEPRQLRSGEWVVEVRGKAMPVALDRVTLASA